MRIGWIMLLLLLLPCWALDVNKSVSGPRLLNIGQKLVVKTVVTTDKSTRIERVEDPLPDSVSVVEAPTGCSVQPRVLVCEYGTEIEGKITITYVLAAQEKDSGISFERAKVDYQTEGIPSTKVSNPIDKIYSIGPPELNFTAQKLLIGGWEESPPYMALPESSVTISLGIRNNGAVSAENVTLTVSVNDWGILKREKLDSFHPGEERPVRASFTAPESEGEAMVKVELSWTDSILHRHHEITSNIPIEVSRPKVDADRIVQLKWISEDDELTPIISIKYELKNKGKLPATIILVQRIPDLDNLEIEPNGVTENGNTTIKLELDRMESTEILIQGEATDMKRVNIPSSTIRYYDSRNYEYETFSWDSEIRLVEHSIWSTIYSLIAPFGFTGKLLILTLFIVCAVTAYHLYKARQDNWYLMMIPLILLSLFLISYFSVEGLTWLFDFILTPINSLST